MPISGRMKRTPNTVGVCIDERKKGFKGRIYNCFSKEPQYFNDVTEMIYIMEGVMDALNYPAIKTNPRRFKKTEVNFETGEIDIENKLVEVENLISAGDSDAYLIMVTSRDNSCWQGVIYNKKNDVEENFNSDLELFKLLG